MDFYLFIYVSCYISQQSVNHPISLYLSFAEDAGSCRGYSEASIVHFWVAIIKWWIVKLTCVMIVCFKWIFRLEIAFLMFMSG
jgi:hypothetical protein